MICIRKIPLTSAHFVTPTIAFSREVDPFRMAKLITKRKINYNPIMKLTIKNILKENGKLLITLLTGSIIFLGDPNETEIFGGLKEKVMEIRRLRRLPHYP